LIPSVREMTTGLEEDKDNMNQTTTYQAFERRRKDLHTYGRAAYLSHEPYQTP
jgi:hypothetical protein